MVDRPFKNWHSWTMLGRKISTNILLLTMMRSHWRARIFAVAGQRRPGGDGLPGGLQLVVKDIVDAEIIGRDPAQSFSTCSRSVSRSTARFCGSRKAAIASHRDASRSCNNELAAANFQHGIGDSMQRLQVWVMPIQLQPVSLVPAFQDGVGPARAIIAKV